MLKSVQRWALAWYSKSRLDGVTEHIIYHDYLPVLFVKRKEARDFANKHYGYIKRWHELRAEPHGWRFPRIIKVRVVEQKGR